MATWSKQNAVCARDPNDTRIWRVYWAEKCSDTDAYYLKLKPTTPGGAPSNVRTFEVEKQQQIPLPPPPATTHSRIVVSSYVTRVIYDRQVGDPPLDVKITDLNGDENDVQQEQDPDPITRQLTGIDAGMNGRTLYSERIELHADVPTST